MPTSLHTTPKPGANTDAYTVMPPQGKSGSTEGLRWNHVLVTQMRLGLKMTDFYLKNLVFCI